MAKYDLVILGSGVIGLSIALDLANAGITNIAIVAKDLPEDSDSFGFASPWAGCNWHTFEDDGDSPAAKRDAVTYRRLAKLAKEQPDLCEKIPFFDLWSKRVPKETKWSEELVGGIREVTADEYDIPGNHPHAHMYSSYVLHAPKYVKHLASLVRQKGIPIIRQRLSALDEAYDVPGVGPVDLVINATGLGSRSLIGVEDPKVHPARGQTVLIKTNTPRRCIMQCESFMGDDDSAKPAYIIPRPGPEGQVILGGTYIPNDYSSQPDLAEAERIIKACYNLDPSLAPNGGSWEDIEIISHNVGLRPAREGGARVELEKKTLGSRGEGLLPGPGKSSRREVAVVHAYGFGSAGFQASLGAAEEVVALVKKAQKGISGSRQSKL